VDDLDDGIEDAQPAEDETLTIAQLADAIDVDPEYLYDIDIGMGEGKDSVKLGQLKDDYQSVTTERDALVTERDALKSEAADPNSIANLGQGVSQEMIKAFANMDNLQNMYENFDWRGLSEEPDGAGKVALKKQEFQEAFQRGQGFIQQADNNMKQLKSQNLQKAAAQMFEIIPEWKDETIRRTDQGKMKALMLAEGYNDNAVNSIVDPRAMKMLNELVSLREYKANVEAGTVTALKKVRKAPKVLKGIGRKSPNLKAEAKKLVKVARGASISKRKGAEVEAVKAILAAG